MRKTLTCIACPIGCSIEIEYEGKKIIKVLNNKCERGRAYAENEFYHPCRILTTSVYVQKADVMLPVRSDAPVPKDKLLKCIKKVKHIKITPPVKAGQVILRNIADNINIISCADLDVD